MPFDSVFLTALAGELRTRLVGARIDKVNQPGRDTVVLNIHGPAGDGRLLITAGTGSARLNFTNQRPENPASPPMFCMLLRKHLVGARITGVTQPPYERLVVLELDATDALGDTVRRSLICELMGRYANIILTDGDGIILDCLRRIDGEMSDKRMVLPGLRYRLPPAPERYTPETMPDALLRELESADLSMPLDAFLGKKMTGLSPTLYRELCARAYGDSTLTVKDALFRDEGAALKAEIISFRTRMETEDFTPTLILQDGTATDYTVLPLTQFGTLRTCRTAESFSALLDDFYAARDLRERMRQKSLSLTRTVKNARDRTARRLANQKTELAATEKREEHRICGDLLTSNLYRMERGMRSVTVEDYYAEGMPERTIALDPLKTPQQNAAKYYKDYAKARTAAKVLTDLISQGETELTYLESVLDELDRAESEKDLLEIREELISAGYVTLKKGERRKAASSQPLCYRTSTGFAVRVGRSNAQNDRLTLKESFKTDLWLHTQKIHGSHVVVSMNGMQPDDTTIFEAATLAAYHSQGRNSGTVPVDYALIRYVKKPSCAKPGMVIYTDYKTILVKPDGALCGKLALK